MKATDTFSKYTSSFTIEGDWAFRAEQLKKEFSELTDADLLFERGRENELITRLKSRLNKSREVVINLIKKVRLERF
jgi:hypothetical protein